MKLRIEYFIYLFVLLSSCEESREKVESNNFKVIEKYENGETKIGVSTFDSIFVIQKFNQNRVLVDSIPFNSDSLENGVRKHFHNDEATNYYSYTKYKDGIQNGNVYGLYLNGSIKFRGHNKEGKKNGVWEFFTLSKVKQTYEYFNLLGKRSYLRKYDEDEKLISSMGNGISDIIYERKIIKVNENFVCKIQVATPSEVNIEVFVAEELKENGSPVDGEFYEYTLEGNGSFYYSITFDKAGIYKKGFGWLLSDTINNVEEKDFQVIEITVVE